MSSPLHEEDLLRSVALQNAKSILIARQRAEEDLFRANEALEARTSELARSLAMMHATLESTTDGILVTDCDGIVTGYNETVIEMWGLAHERQDRLTHSQIIERTSKCFADPELFSAR